MHVNKDWCVRAGMAAVGIGAVLVLTGCNNLYHFGDYSMSVKNAQIIIAACEAQEIRSIFVDEWRRGDGESSTERIWEASGSMHLKSGDKIVVGGDNTGLVNSISAEPLLEPGLLYDIEIDGTVEGVASAIFTIPEDGIPNGQWLSPEGILSDDPCVE